MGIGRVEAQDPGAGLSAGLWFSGVPLDTLGAAAAELARVPGVAGAFCAPGPDAALRALCDAFAPRPVAAAGARHIRKANLLSLLRVRTPGTLEAALDVWMRGPVPAAFALDAAGVDARMDPIVSARMAAAPTDSIRAAYRLLHGRLGWAAAVVGRRRFETALNSRRFAALGVPRPLLIVECAPERLAEFAAPGVVLAVPYQGAPDLPAPPAPRDGDAYDEARRLLDKLANYQLDLDAEAVR